MCRHKALLAAVARALPATCTATATLDALGCDGACETLTCSDAELAGTLSLLIHVAGDEGVARRLGTAPWLAWLAARVLSLRPEVVKKLKLFCCFSVGLECCLLRSAM